MNIDLNQPIDNTSSMNIDLNQLPSSSSFKRPRLLEEKKALDLEEEKTKQEENYTWAIVDGVKDKAQMEQQQDFSDAWRQQQQQQPQHSEIPWRDTMARFNEEKRTRLVRQRQQQQRSLEKRKERLDRDTVAKISKALEEL